MDEVRIKPIYMLADSQLLFWTDEHGERFLAKVRRQVESLAPRAAYLGAANGDAPEFYDLFVAAMESVGITETLHVKAAPSADELAFLERADLVLLAGGDAKHGNDLMKKSGVRQMVVDRYQKGAVVMGVSAGAMQLGVRGYTSIPRGDTDTFIGMKLVPAIIGAHEPADWPGLRMAVRLRGDLTQGIGIPAGGGLVFDPNEWAFEPVRLPTTSLWLENEELQETLVLPDTRNEAQLAEATPAVLEPTEILPAPRSTQRPS